MEKIEKNKNYIDVAKVAALARLKVEDSEKEQLQKDMNKIVDYVNQLSELDLSEIKPTFHAVALENVWREDKSVEADLKDEIMSNAPSTIDEELVRVPQVLPGEGES